MQLQRTISQVVASLLAVFALPLVSSGTASAAPSETEFLRWTADGKVALVPDAVVPGDLDLDVVKLALEELNEHHAAGRVRISPNFDVTATRAGKLWIGEQVNELANGCSRPRQITASWLGLHVETHDVCDRASPPDPVLLQSEIPTREQPRTDDFSTASHVVGCAISIVGFALASAALIASGGSMFWWGIAALGWSTVAFVHSCGQVVSVASKKHNGWGHDRRYATSGYDSHGYYHRVYYDANYNRYW